MEKKMDLKKISIIALLSALAFLMVAVIRIPVVAFLKYEPKDVIIVIGGFIYGPMVSIIISVFSSLLEMLTISETGIIGAVMNIVSSCAFAVTAAFIYSRKKSINKALLSLIIGTFVMVIIMLLWNYFLTPIYMGYPREAVAAMLLPQFLPFNLIKGILNTAITMLIYKPLVTALRKAGLIQLSENNTSGTITKANKTGIIILSVFLLITSVLAILVMQKVI